MVNYLVGSGAGLLLAIFLIMFESKLNRPHPDLMKKSHRHPTNERRRRGGDVTEQMDYFKDLKSSTSQSVRGFNAELNKTVEG